MKKQPSVNYREFNEDVKLLIIQERAKMVSDISKFDATIYEIQFNLPGEKMNQLIKKHIPKCSNLGIVRCLVTLKCVGKEMYAIKDLYFVCASKLNDKPSGWHWEIGKFFDGLNLNNYFRQFVDDGPAKENHMNSPKLYNELVQILNGGTSFIGDLKRRWR